MSNGSAILKQEISDKVDKIRSNREQGGCSVHTEHADGIVLMLRVGSELLDVKDMIQEVIDKQRFAEAEEFKPSRINWGKIAGWLGAVLGAAVATYLSAPGISRAIGE